VDEIVATLPPLGPRLYAIASCPSLHPTEVHVLVRAVYGDRERKGVASNLLAHNVFQGDQVVASVVSHERMSLPADAPVVLVALGVGLGRFRGLLQELSCRGRQGGSWLIYAACAGGEESLYDKELSSLRRAGTLEHLDVVSAPLRGRRGGPRDVLKKRSRRLGAWLSQGAHVYVSGELRGRASSLADTLVDALCRHGRMSRPHAEGHLLAMRREGRYLEEVY
jgi:sulfite reductase (NADPH) flavoprotein alpha-component